MNYFLDTEFLELGYGQPIELISIAIVAEDNRELYLVNQDFPTRKAEGQWVEKNVLPHLPPLRSNLWCSIPEIKIAITRFICSDPKPRFWGYFCDYDWTLLCMVMGKMSELPETWPMFCIDLKQEMKRLGIMRQDLPAHSGRLHTAIDDAWWNRQVYDYIKNWIKDYLQSEPSTPEMLFDV